MSDSTKIILGVVAAAAMIVLVSLFFIGKTATKVYVDEYNEQNTSTCVESDVKQNAVGDVFTCIEGAWVYTGSITDYKG